jgi:BirA family biotin operon repressor/biotin-[acetyl-CoA-carboxylase] ligase
VDAVPILALEAIDSTNAEARRRAEAGAAGPLWITARRQSAGRGRRGRAWETGEGNLAATYLFAADRRVDEAAQVSFVAALAVADLAEAFLPGRQIGLKWPNDLMIAGRKAAGILVESGALAPGRLWIAVGVGVNLAHAPDIPERPATAFAGHGVCPSPAEALAVLAAAFERWRILWDRQGFAAIAEAWTAKAHGLGERCEARLADRTLIGLAEGLDPDGALRLKLDDGQAVRITAGDVFFG